MKVKQLNQRSSSATTVSERWSPEWTASLWSTYDWAGFKLGLGARYVDEQKPSCDRQQRTCQHAKYSRLCRI